jgi:asparagine synthase (glutamine-hydrolysing)
MTKVDKMSMAVSLESREPLLDHKLLEFAATVPTGLKLKNGQSKYLLRRLLERRLPKAIVDRPKHGFEAPIGDWLRGPLAPMVDGLLTDGRLRDRGIFDDRAVASVWREHREGRQDHRHRLWSLVMLELWFRQFVDGSTMERSATPVGQREVAPAFHPPARDGYKQASDEGEAA